MIQRISALLLIVIFGACVSEIVLARKLEGIYDLEDGQALRIELSLAKLHIQATDRSDVGVDLTVRCRWQLAGCEAAVEDVEIEAGSSSRRLTLELTGMNTWQSPLVEIEGIVEVPRSAALEVEMSIADLEITDVEKDTRIELGIGEVRVQTLESAVAEARIDVGIGQASMTSTGERVKIRRSNLVGQQIRWQDGTGEAEIDIEVGIGDASVRLN